MLISAKSSSSAAKRARASSATQQTPQQPPPPPQQAFSPEHDTYLDDEFLCPSPELLQLHCYHQQDPQQESQPVNLNQEPSHAPTLCRELGEMMLRGEFCDLTLITETATIPVHACVVASCSQIVRTYLKQSPVKHLRLCNLPGLTEIQKRALSDEFAVRNLLCDFAYFGHFSLSVRSSASAVSMLDDDDGVGAMERTVLLLAGAIGLGISPAVQVATNILKSRIDVANGLLIFNAAWDLGCTELELVAEAFVDANFPLVCLEQSWIDATDSMLSRILCKDELVTNAGEMEVFRAISRWALENFASRAMMVEAMLSNPRIFRIQWLNENNLADLLLDDIVCHFSSSIRRMLEQEIERRRAGIPADVNVPCRFFPSSASPLPCNTNNNTSELAEDGDAEAATPATAAAAVAPMVAPVAAATGSQQQLFQSLRVLSGHEKPVCSLAANDRWIVSGSQDHTIRVWDLQTNSTKTILRGHVDSVSVLRFFTNRQLISGSFDRSIRVWDDADGWKACGFVAQVAHEDPITCLMVITRTHQLASGTSGGEIKIWSPLQDNAWALFFMVQNAHAHVLWSCCEWGNTVVTGSSDTEIRVWNSSSWELQRRLQFHKDEVQALLVIGDELYSGSDDGVVNVYRTLEPKPVRSTGLGRAIMAFSDLESHLVVGLGDGGILVLNCLDLTLVAELKSHASSVMALLVVKSRHLVSGSFDKTVRVWERSSTHSFPNNNNNNKLTNGKHV